MGNLMEKRGLSAVVITMLIIILSLTSIGIIWTALNPSLQGAGKQAQQTDCLQISVHPTLCRTEGTLVNVQVERDSGQATLSELRFILTKENGQTEVVNVEAYNLDEHERRTFPLEYSGDSLLTSVDIAPLLGNVVCSPTGAPLDCSEDSGGEQVFVTECTDGEDNDGDGWKDFGGNFEDPGCENEQDNDESLQGSTLCSDEIDNDGDGFIDWYDGLCSDPMDNRELALCQDGIDNDGDRLIDLADTLGCSNVNDDDEANVPDSLPACSDMIDNDGDGNCDFDGATGNISCSGQADSGCASANDGDESDDPLLCPYGNDSLLEYANCDFTIDLQNRWYEDCTNGCGRPTLGQLGVSNKAYTMNSAAWGLGIYDNSVTILRNFTYMGPEEIDSSFQTWLNDRGEELIDTHNDIEAIFLIDIEGVVHPQNWGELYCDDVDYTDPYCVCTPDDINDGWNCMNEPDGIYDENGVPFNDTIDAIKRRINYARTFFPQSEISYYGVIQPNTNGINTSDFRETRMAAHRAAARGVFDGVDYVNPWVPMYHSRNGQKVNGQCPGVESTSYRKRDESAKQALEATATLRRTDGTRIGIAPITTFSITSQSNADCNDNQAAHIHASEAIQDQHEEFRRQSDAGNIDMILYWIGNEPANYNEVIPDYFSSMRVVPSACGCTL